VNLLDELLIGWDNQADYPYNEYKLYKVFHQKEQRWYAQLVKTNGERTTVSYARYLMSVKLKRFLTDKEEVDHKDDNKQNDDINNLQLLTKKENNEKSQKDVTFIDLICPVCGKEFKRTTQRVLFKLQHGKQPCCSRSCGGIYSHQ
jgi:hypothetical protein